MDIDSINKKFIPSLLTHSKFRVLRHLILLLIITVIISSLSINGDYKSIQSKYDEWLVLFILFVAIIYLNMYVLVPRFLLKNKFHNYFIFVFIFILILLFLIPILQLIFHNVDWDNGINHMRIFCSFVFALLFFGVMIVCSSSLVILKKWMISNQRIDELQEATLKSELQQLKNQINPHFLFNMLNNANIMVKQNPMVASEILTKLNDLLCYQIEDSAKDLVYLENDISFLTDYLDLEKSRRDRFEYTVVKKGEMRNIQIAPLLFIPFVENAVKHSPEHKNTSQVNISFEIHNRQLIFSCINSKPKVPLSEKEGGLGLMNIKRRLGLLYGSGYSLQLNESETEYSVHLELKL